jgi:hypothetical protein
MMRRREELDETIDRVAAAITFVPADPALAGRVADRIRSAQNAFEWRLLLAGAAGVAAVVIGIAVMTNDRRQPIEPPLVMKPSPSELAPVAEARPPAPPEPRVDPAPLGRTTPSAPTRLAEAAPSVPQIAALDAPALLDVPDLPTSALTIAPAEIAPLDLASLAIADLGDHNDPKE